MTRHTSEGIARSRIFKGEIVRKECDDEETHNFLLVVKIRNRLMEDEE